MRSSAPTSTSGLPLLLLGAIALATVLGCGGGTSQPDASAPPEVDAQEAGALPSAYCTDKQALTTVTDVSGTWVIRALASQVVVAPIVGTLRPKTLFYMLADISQSGASIVASGRYCDRAEVDQPGTLTKVVVPDQWAHTEKVFTRPGTLAVGTDGIAVLAFSPLVELAGAVADATTDALPTGLDDRRVIDEDGDGHPGITMNITGALTGSLYSVQRQTTALAGIAVAPDRFEGKLDFASQQLVLDSYPTLLTGLYRQAAATTDPTPCTSTFEMVKVSDELSAGALDASSPGGEGPDGGTPGCAWVRANETVLFPGQIGL
jgi:hypothetical protein